MDLGVQKMSNYENKPEVIKILSKLEKLEELKSFGAITEEEYIKKKRELLSLI